MTDSGFRGINAPARRLLDRRAFRRRVRELEQTAAGPDWRHAGIAASQLGELYESRGMGSDARTWYEAALASDEPDAAPVAGLGLATLLLETGDEDAAIAALTRATAFRGDAAALAGLLLGRLLLDRGDVEAARPALRFAASTDYATASAGGAVLLGQVLEAEGNLWGAELLFERAAQSADEAAARTAAESLGRVRAGQQGQERSRRRAGLVGRQRHLRECGARRAGAVCTRRSGPSRALVGLRARRRQRVTRSSKAARGPTGRPSRLTARWSARPARSRSAGGAEILSSACESAPGHAARLRQRLWLGVQERHIRPLESKDRAKPPQLEPSAPSR